MEDTYKKIKKQADQARKGPTVEDCIPIEIEGKESIPLIIRNVDGNAVLMSEDGKLIGSQIPLMGFYYYVGHGAERVTMFRATFRLSEMKSDTT